MLQDASTYHQYRWENYIYKENCTKCAASKTAYVCSFHKKSLKYCTNCREVICNDAKFLSGLQSIRKFNSDACLLFNSRSGIPSEIYTALGISLGYEGPLMHGFHDVVGTLPEGIVFDFVVQAGAQIRVKTGTALYDRLRRSKGRPVYKGDWVWLFPAYVSPGIQTGWFIYDNRGRSVTVTLPFLNLPLPVYTFLHIPKTVEHVCAFTDIREAGAYAAMQKINTNSNAMILIRGDDINI